MMLPLPFASKQMPDGKKLYRRKHGYQVTLSASGSTFLIITCPYATAKINEAEILWAPEGVTLNMKIKDSVTGTYTTVPNYPLNQFGFTVNVATTYFQDISAYDADIFQGMQIEFEFINNNGITKPIGINMVFHEVVSG